MTLLVPSRARRPSVEHRAQRIVSLLADAGGQMERAALRARLVADKLLPPEVSESTDEQFRSVLRRLQREGRISYDLQNVKLERREMSTAAVESGDDYIAAFAREHKLDADELRDCIRAGPPHVRAYLANMGVRDAYPQRPMPALVESAEAKP